MTSHKMLDLTAKVSIVSALSSQLEKKGQPTDMTRLSLDMLTDTDASHGVNNKASLTQLASAVIYLNSKRKRDAN